MQYIKRRLNLLAGHSLAGLACAVSAASLHGQTATGPSYGTAPEPLNDQMLYIPYKPSLGSQELLLSLKGARGNENGG